MIFVWVAISALALAIAFIILVERSPVQQCEHPLPYIKNRGLGGYYCGKCGKQFP